VQVDCGCGLVRLTVFSRQVEVRGQLARSGGGRVRWSCWCLRDRVAPQLVAARWLSSIPGVVGGGHPPRHWWRDPPDSSRVALLTVWSAMAWAAAVLDRRIWQCLMDGAAPGMRGPMLCASVVVAVAAFVATMDGQGRCCQRCQARGGRGVGGAVKLGAVVLVRSCRLVLAAAVKVEGS
jgi:hypothetical protein